MERVVASDDPMIDADRLRAELDADVVVAETGDEDALRDAAEGAAALVVDVNTPVTAGVLDVLVDGGQWFEVQPGFEAAVICALAHHGGRPVAVVANQAQVNPRARRRLHARPNGCRRDGPNRRMPRSIPTPSAT
jgi:acetyl-CoA carboxylase carboxyltransferase component